MSNEPLSRRVPWIAVALSFLSAGVGHIYCGRIVKGLLLYFAWLLLPLCGLVATMIEPSASGLALLLLPAVAVVAAYVYAALDAWQVARQTEFDFILRDYNRARVYWLLIAGQLTLAIGLIIGMRSFIYEAFVIPTKSMSPTILPGDRVMARKLFSRDHMPERGHLIVYRNPTSSGSTRFLGRVIAVAGDHVTINGQSLSINGKELPRDPRPDRDVKDAGVPTEQLVAWEENSGHRYLVAYDRLGDNPSAAQKSITLDTSIPERHVFVLGDNRDRSRDSRQFGAIHMGDVVGYIDYVFWPAESWSRFGTIDK